jgi:thiamine biosynthesis protein ThiC
MNEEWNEKMKEYRKKWRWEKMLKKGQCPMCGMRLEYQELHKGCPFLLIDANGKIPFLQNKV